MRWVSNRSSRDDRLKAKGWHRRFAWLPVDLNQAERQKPHEWIWLEWYWRRFSHTEDWGGGYGADLYEGRLDRPLSEYEISAGAHELD